MALALRPLQLLKPIFHGVDIQNHRTSHAKIYRSFTQVRFANLVSNNKKGYPKLNQGNQSMHLNFYIHICVVLS